MDGVVAHRNGFGEMRRNLFFKGLKARYSTFTDNEWAF